MFCEELYLHFGSNSTCNEKILILQKKKKVMAGAEPKNSCRDLFKR
jgi:hypothetical protein